MELSGSCDYRFFLENDEDIRQSKSSCFYGLLKKCLTHSKRRSSCAVLFICFLCFLGFSFFFIYLHNLSAFSDDEIIVPFFPSGRIADNYEEKNENDAKIWQWKESKFEEEFKKFQINFSKIYANTDETEKRYAIFKKNLYFIHSHNEQRYTYTLKMNGFGDLTNEEFRSQYVSFKKEKIMLSMGEASDLLDLSEDEVPDSVSWKNKKCVTEVKNQKQCGSCWAFSAVGSIEGAICAKSGKLVNLSEQQVIDCSKKEGNEGCNGGDMDFAFKYVINNGGLCTEKDYPYTAKENICKAKTCENAVQIKGFKDVPYGNEKALCAAVHKYGTISVAVEADKLAFQFYHSGIFSVECGSNINHAVLLVGYNKLKKKRDVSAAEEKTGDFKISEGRSKKEAYRHSNKLSYLNTNSNNKNYNHNNDDAVDYFEIKNSWGNEWGENGFMRLAMDKGPKGECGILMYASFPIL